MQLLICPGQDMTWAQGNKIVSSTFWVFLVVRGCFRILIGTDPTGIRETAFLDNGDFDAVDGWEGVEEAVPLVSAFAADPELAGRCAEVEGWRLQRVDRHRVAQDREVALFGRQTFGKAFPLVAAVVAAPDGGFVVGAGSGRRVQRHDVNGVRIVRVYNDRKSEVGRQAGGDGSPGVTVIVAAENSDARPIFPAPVVLHVKPAGSVRVSRDLVDALTELGIRVGDEAGTDSVIGSVERLAAVFAEVMPAGRDSKMHSVAFPDDCVHAQSAVAGMPLSGVLVVADAGHQFPGIAAVLTAEQRRRFDSAKQVAFAAAGFERPDVGQCSPVVFRKCGSRLRFLERLAEVCRAKNLHPEERAAA